MALFSTLGGRIATPLFQSPASTEVWLDPILISRSASGALKGRRLQTTKSRAFKLKFEMMTPAQRTALEGFYDDNRNIPFTFRWSGDGADYSVQFTSEITWSSAGTTWTVDFEVQKV